MLDPEIWKDLSEEGLITKNAYGQSYSISSHGRVKNNSTNKILKLSTTKDGYKFHAFGKNNPTYRIHRLVALCFVSNPDPINFNEVNHIDLNKTNNYYKNLEWCDHDYNMKHASRSGALEGKLQGELQWNAKLKDKEVLEIWLNYLTAKEIEKKYNLSHPDAVGIWQLRRWTHLIPTYLELIDETNIEKVRHDRLIKAYQKRTGLTNLKVYEIYQKCKEGDILQKQLAKEYNVGEPLIRKIKRKDGYFKEIIDSFELDN